jgi:hypothetical protein
MIAPRAVASDASMVVAANNRGTCFVWRLDPANQFEPLHKVDAHNTYCLKALLSPDVKYGPSHLQAFPGSLFIFDLNLWI